MAWMRVGLASTLGGGEVGGLLGWQGDGRLVGWQTCMSLVGKEGGGLRGLQLLATTVSSLSLSSVRMLKGLLWRVWRSCTSGMFLMTFGAVILFNVVATLGGGTFATLGLGAATLGAGVPVCTVGLSGVCRPAKMAVKS